MLLEDIRQRLFSPLTAPGARTIGAELELIPVNAADNSPVLAQRGARPSTVDVLSALGARHGWTEQPAENDPPSWRLPDGACISFEPGGQIEISSAPHPAASALIRSLESTVRLVEDVMREAGIVLVTKGVDPYNSIDSVPLQLHRDRYTGMTRYFNSVGPAGVKMMRQTAALQINVERGDDPRSRWLVMNAIVPLVVALFANSRSYAGQETGHASYRAHLWRTLDPSRTGIAGNDEADLPAAYLRFALDAVAMQSGAGGQGYRTFREWMRSADVGEEQWLFHLSTLFPEVRAKEYFELRSADTIDRQWLAAPIVFVAGLVYHSASGIRAAEAVGPPSEDLLVRAGRAGLKDPAVRTAAQVATAAAIEGATALGEEYISREHREVASEYFRLALSHQPTLRDA